MTDSLLLNDLLARGLVHVPPGTPQQTFNHGAEDLIVYAYGTPPESERAELLADASPTS